MATKLILRGHNVRELEIVGFWDSCLFRPHEETNGLLFKTKGGELLKISYLEIQKAKVKEICKQAIEENL